MESIIVVNGKVEWEYRCQRCGQLRLFAKIGRPDICGNCGSTELLVGKIGTLEAGPWQGD